MIVDYRPHLAAAERAARDAGGLLASLQGRVAAREKAPGDLVTEADSAAQERIRSILLGAFPDHTMLGEEDGLRADPGNPWRWIVDPLDGTVNYAHGLPFWCVSIALEHAGELAVGVIHDPIAGRTFRAARGAGADLDGWPIRTSATATLATALIGVGLPTRFDTDADRQLAYFARMCSGTHSVRRTGSSALNLAWVAAGAFDVFYASRIHPWDVAAGILLVREAGGLVTDLAGGPHDLDGPEILATNRRLHPAAAHALASAWPSSRDPRPE